MRGKLLFTIGIIAALAVSAAQARGETGADGYSNVYVPLPYILSSHQTEYGDTVDLSAIPADRGIFSYVLYNLLNPNGAPPVTAEEQRKAAENCCLLRGGSILPVPRFS